MSAKGYATVLRQATTSHEWDEARRLVREYAASLDVDLSFQNFDHELEHFTVEYAAPRGAFLLAEDAGRYVACIGVRPFSADSGEIKRRAFQDACTAGVRVADAFEREHVRAWLFPPQKIV